MLRHMGSLLVPTSRLQPFNYSSQSVQEESEVYCSHVIAHGKQSTLDIIITAVLSATPCHCVDIIGMIRYGNSYSM